MNRFNMFTWKGKPVLCPNCAGDRRMTVEPATDMLYCPSCRIAVGVVDLLHVNEPEITIEVLDRILQNATYGEGER